LLKLQKFEIVNTEDVKLIESTQSISQLLSFSQMSNLLPTKQYHLPSTKLSETLAFSDSVCVSIAHLRCP